MLWIMQVSFKKLQKTEYTQKRRNSEICVVGGRFCAKAGTQCCFIADGFAARKPL
jgi:hypothetical protein